MLSTVILVAVFIGVATLIGGIAMISQGSASTETEDRLGALTGTGPKKKKSKGEASASVLAQPLDSVPGKVDEYIQRFFNLDRFLSQANVSITTGKFVLISVIMACGGGMATIIVRLHPAIAPFVALTLGIIPFCVIFFKRKRRLTAFGKQLPEALELIARALRAGHSLSAGFQLVGTEMIAPIGVEFSRVYEEQNLGIPLDEALALMTERVPNLDLKFFSTAIILQRQTGGDLAEILDKIGRLIRDRFRIYGQIQALTGEGRISGIVLLAMPPALFVFMLKLNYEYMMLLFEDPLGRKMMVGALVLQLIGALIIKKIIDIKV